MEQKTKFIIIGLIGALVVFFMLLMGTLSQKAGIARERDELKKENSSLNNKIGNLENSLRDSKKQLDMVKVEIDNLSRDKAEVERRLDLANRAKDELVEKLKTMQSRPQAPQQQVAAYPQTGDAYWASVLKQKTDLELQLSNLSNQFKSMQITNEQLQREKTSLELEISNLRREKEDLKREFEYNKKILDSISQELVRERSDKIQIQDSFKLIKNENTVLTRQLESLNNRKINLEKKLQELEANKDEIENKYSAMQSMLTDRISQVSGLKEELDGIRQGQARPDTTAEEKGSVELPPIVVRPQVSDMSKEAGTTCVNPASKGKVLAVNKDSNFVIIDLGEDAGVRMGDTFQIYKGTCSIATVEAIQVRKNIAACDIKKQTDVISVGDSAQ